MLNRAIAEPPTSAIAGAPDRLRHRLLNGALEHRLLPDSLLRLGSRTAARARERAESRGGAQKQAERVQALVARMSTGAIAERPQTAQRRPHELPGDFLGLMLGPRRKTSGGLWPPETRTLAQAEEAMLRLTCERAAIVDGMRILDVGCGWGSLSLWLAEQYPNAHVTGVSGSHLQRDWIESRRAELGLNNLRVLTADVNDFRPPTHYHRIVSIETFEHMRNWHELLRRLSAWCRPDGKAFVHVVSHRTLPYLLRGTWAAERSFTTGLMPSHDLILRFGQHMRVTNDWIVPGTHYAHTLQAWLRNLDAHPGEALAALQSDGRTRSEARRLLGGWRLFLLSARELWRYRDGDRWLVSHYLLEPVGRR
jgi:cyclopropane-fatty-acyl-phospholipid synthase